MKKRKEYEVVVSKTKKCKTKSQKYKKNIWACGQKDQNEKSNMVYIKMGKGILKKKHKNTKEKTQNNSYLVNFSDSQSASLHWSHHLPFCFLTIVPTLCL